MTYEESDSPHRGATPPPMPAQLRPSSIQIHDTLHYTKSTQILQYDTTLTGDTELGLQHGESFVLLLMFYEVLNERIGRFNVMSRLMSAYERYSGKYKHRHVGISLGVRQNNKQIAVLPYDLSCWNSRLSGIGYIASDAQTALQEAIAQTRRNPENSISASDALYVDIHVTTVDQILQNFRLGSEAFVWNKLPRMGIRYPSLRTILQDHISYMLFAWRRPVNMPQVDAELEIINSEAQCAQYVLLLLIFLLRTQQIPHATSIHMNSIFALVYQKTSLHPHTLWQVLLATGVFAAVDEKCQVSTLQQFTRNRNLQDGIRKLTDIKLTNPYDTLIALNEILIWEFKHTHQFS